MRGVSSFITRAIAHELEREQLSAFIDEMDREFGPVPKEIMAEARRAWRGGVRGHPLLDEPVSVGTMYLP